MDLIASTIKLLRQLQSQNLGFNNDVLPDDIKKLNNLEESFSHVQRTFIQVYRAVQARNSCHIPTHLSHTGAPGRPSIIIPKELLEELRGLGFAWAKIATMFGVSRWTIMRRVDEYQLTGLQIFTDISDDKIDKIVKDYNSHHGASTGEPFLSGHFRSLGLHVQRRRIRSSINRVDPVNTALRWGALVSRRTYYVAWPNSLWHIDGHHSLIRWNLIIYGCIDGKSRKVMFLRCNPNNLAQTVLDLFQNSIQENGGLWPSRIRVDYGVENVLICDAMAFHRGEGRGSFIAGSSTRNQRIERLWRDVFRCVCQIFYYTFYAMEQSGILGIENHVHIFALHLRFLKRINFALTEFQEMYNSHRLSTENGWTPNQIWLNGMMDNANPLSANRVHDTISDAENYGVDDMGLTSIEQSSNNVVVPELNIEQADLIAEHVHRTINVIAPANDNGISIYLAVLEAVVRRLESTQ